MFILSASEALPDDEVVWAWALALAWERACDPVPSLFLEVARFGLVVARDALVPSLFLEAALYDWVVVRDLDVAAAAALVARVQEWVRYAVGVVPGPDVDVSLVAAQASLHVVVERFGLVVGLDQEAVREVALASLHVVAERFDLVVALGREAARVAAQDVRRVAVERFDLVVALDREAAHVVAQDVRHVAAERFDLAESRVVVREPVVLDDAHYQCVAVRWVDGRSWVDPFYELFRGSDWELGSDVPSSRGRRYSCCHCNRNRERCRRIEHDRAPNDLDSIANLCRSSSRNRRSTHSHSPAWHFAAHKEAAVAGSGQYRFDRLQRRHNQRIAHEGLQHRERYNWRREQERLQTLTTREQS